MDVTVFEMFEGVMEVRASSGNNKLGGKDFDEAIIQYIIERFNKAHQSYIQNDIRAMARLKKEAEDCKIALSGIPPARPARKRLPLLFPMINGILQVDARIVSTGEKASITISTNEEEMTEEIDITKYEQLQVRKTQSKWKSRKPISG